MHLSDQQILPFDRQIYENKSIFFYDFLLFFYKTNNTENIKGKAIYLVDYPNNKIKIIRE